MAPLTCTHLDAVTEIARLSFPVPWGRNDLAYFISHATGFCLGAFCGKEKPWLDAYLLALLVQGDLDIVSVAARPEARRKGLGERLLREAMGRAGVKRVFLEVAVENTAAIALYRKIGFVTIGRRPKYYQGVGDALTLKWTP